MRNRIFNLIRFDSRQCDVVVRNARTVFLIFFFVFFFCFVFVHFSAALGQHNDNFVCCPDDALTWESRKYLIVQEIIQNDPDVICLQVRHAAAHFYAKFEIPKINN